MFDIPCSSAMHLALIQGSRAEGSAEREGVVVLLQSWGPAEPHPEPPAWREAEVLRPQATRTGLEQLFLALWGPCHLV